MATPDRLPVGCPAGRGALRPDRSPRRSHSKSPRSRPHPRSSLGTPGRRRATDGTKGTRVAVVTMKQLLEAGVHFGHQTRRWNPKMKRFIFGERNGIYIIDLQQTLARIETSYTFVRDVVANGGSILFIGTKK